MLPNDGSMAARGIFPRYVQELKPDTIITLHDPWMISYISQIKHPRWIGYTTVDGAPIHLAFKKVFEAMSQTVAMSKFGQDAIKQLGVQNTEMIYHGVDTNLYRKLSPQERDNAKREIAARIKSASGHDILDKFIVGCVARNTERKRFDRLMQAFAKFAQNKNDVFLLIHTDPNDPYPTGQGLEEFRFRFRIQDKCCFSPLQTNFLFGCSREEMIKLYNIFDVHALSTGGEGFGLPIAESMACGVPNIVTGYSAPKELVENHGWLVDINTFYYYSKYNIKRALCDIDNLTDCMEEAYQDTKKRKLYGRKSRDWVIKNLDWDSVIIPQWEKNLNNIGSKETDILQVSKGDE